MSQTVLKSAELLALAAMPRVLVCCDYDGTLAPIVADRDRAFPLPQASAALERLRGCQGISVAVVSGRSVAVLKRLSGFSDQITMVGSHGAEFAEGEFPGMGPDQQLLLNELREIAHKITSDISGADVEEKPVSVAVHTRQASPTDSALVMAEADLKMVKRPGVFVTVGKEVLEVAVLHADKGEAVDQLRASSGAQGVLFIGDDVTDERAFAKLSDSDVGVKVGVGDTAAQFRVESPEQTLAVLGALADIRGC